MRTKDGICLLVIKGYLHVAPNLKTFQYTLTSLEIRVRDSSLQCGLNCFVSGIVNWDDHSLNCRAHFYLKKKAAARTISNGNSKIVVRSS